MDDRRSDDPVEQELEFHLSLRARELRRRGLAAEEARRSAIRAFGDLESTRRYCRRQSRRGRRRRWRRRMLDDTTQDLRFALRQITRSPVTAAVIVLTLALGIGANTAIFSLVEAALLRSAPVDDPASLVALWTTCRRGAPRCASSYLDIQDYRERPRTLADLAYAAGTRASLGDETGTRVVAVQRTSGNYFPLLGVQPGLGRLIVPADDLLGGPPIAVLSHDLWRDQFAERRDVVGDSILLSGTAHRVVGVTPPGFRGLSLRGGADVYVPFAAGPAVDEELLASRGSRWIGGLVGRMAPGATLDQVRAEMSALSDQLAAEDPEARGPRTITVDSARYLLLPVGNEETLERFLTILLTVVGLTLLLTCANLANLQLARASSRHRELAVRAAIGAGRGRLVRQMLTESLVLSLLGGLAGLAVGPLMIRALSGFELPGRVRVADIGASLDPRVLAFAFVVTVLTGVLFGLGPSITSARADLFRALASGSRAGAESSPLARGGLVAVQVGLSLVLLAGAFLFIQALRTGLDMELGFDGGDDLVLATVDLSFASYEPDQAQALLESLERRLGASAGVTAFAAATRVPLMTGGDATMLQAVDGYEPAPDEELRLEYNVITPGFFAALGLPIVEGDVFDAMAGATDGDRLLVISEEMASRWWPAGDAVGGTVHFFGEQVGRVVGVATDTKWDDGMLAEDYPFAYLPMTGATAADRPITLLLRTDRPAATAAQLRSTLREVDPTVPLLQVSTLGDLRRRVLLPQRMGAGLLGAFAALALLLSAVGIYGVVRHAVGQRTREIGIRIALGASNGRIAGQVASGVLTPVLVGVGTGVVAILALTGSVRSFLYGVDPTAPWTLAMVVGSLTAITAVAAWIPARRAARVDPMRALGQD